MRPVHSVLLLCVLASFAGVGIAQLERFPPPPPVHIKPLLPELVLPRRGPRPASSSAGAIADALRKHPEHGKRFVVKGVHGPSTASHLVFVIPQYHRSTTLPLDWTSVGLAVAEVQRNIEALITVLHREHGLACVGTEGDAADKLEKPYELEDLAYRWQEMQRARAAALEVLDAATRKKVAAHAEVLDVVLETAVKERMALLDGVGMAQVRIGSDLGRFGLEDRALNQKAVRIARDRDKVLRALAKLAPDEAPEVMDALGEMWLKEYPAFNESTLAPLDDALSALDKQRLALRVSGADGIAEVLGRYVAKVRTLADNTIKAEAVRATYDYYRELKGREAEAASPSGEGRALSPEERREKARLEKEAKRLRAAYADITQRARDEHAAKKIHRQLTTHGSCAAVMGANHVEGLRAALVEQGLRTGTQRAVVVIEPWTP